MLQSIINLITVCKFALKVNDTSIAIDSNKLEASLIDKIKKLVSQFELETKCYLIVKLTFSNYYAKNEFNKYQKHSFSEPKTIEFRLLSSLKNETVTYIDSITGKPKSFEKTNISYFESTFHNDVTIEVLQLTNN